ncbi:hypothetical protein HFP72_21350 [Nocardiopsis sp. ARC36]
MRGTLRHHRQVHRALRGGRPRLGRVVVGRDGPETGAAGGGSFDARSCRSSANAARRSTPRLRAVSSPSTSGTASTRVDHPRPPTRLNAVATASPTASSFGTAREGKLRFSICSNVAGPPSGPRISIHAPV